MQIVVVTNAFIAQCTSPTVYIGFMVRPCGNPWNVLPAGLCCIFNIGPGKCSITVVWQGGEVVDELPIGF